MEVHHHGHKGSKNWKTLLAEFFMLFLAVFSGFIAENLREHYVERERAHQYIVSMLNDLGKDTLHLQETIRINKKRVSGIDSLLMALSVPSSDSANRQVYRYTRYVISNDIFENAGTTITQLKNAGGYRLITDTSIVNRIMNYDLKNEDMKEQADVYAGTTIKILDMIGEYMDLSAWNNATGINTYYIEKDPAKKRIFYNKCFIQKKLIENYVGMLTAQKQQAIEDISFLSKKI